MTCNALDSQKRHPSCSSSECTSGKRLPQSQNPSNAHEIKGKPSSSFLSLPPEYVVGISPEVETILCETLLYHLQKEVEEHSEVDKSGRGVGKRPRQPSAERSGTDSEYPSLLGSSAQAMETEEKGTLPSLKERPSCARMLPDVRRAVAAWWEQSPSPATLSSSPSTFQTTEGGPPMLQFGTMAATTSGGPDAALLPITTPTASYQRLHDCLARVVRRAYLQHPPTAASLRHQAFLCKLLSNVPQVVEDPLFWTCYTPEAGEGRETKTTALCSTSMENATTISDIPYTENTRNGSEMESISLSTPSMSGGELFCILLSAVLSPAAAAPPLLPTPPCHTPDSRGASSLIGESGEASKAKTSCCASSGASWGEEKDSRMTSTTTPSNEMHHLLEEERRALIVWQEMPELAELYLLLSSGPWATLPPSQWGGGAVPSPTASPAEEQRVQLQSSHTPKKKKKNENVWDETTTSTPSSSFDQNKTSLPIRARERMVLFMILRGITQMLQRQLLRLHEAREKKEFYDPLSRWKLPSPHGVPYSSLPIITPPLSVESKAEAQNVVIQPVDKPRTSEVEATEEEGREKDAVPMTPSQKKQDVQAKEGKTSPILCVVLHILCKAETVTTMTKDGTKTKREVQEDEKDHSREMESHDTVPASLRSNDIHYLPPSQKSDDKKEEDEEEEDRRMMKMKNTMWTAAGYREAIHEALRLYFTLLSEPSFVLSSTSTHTVVGEERGDAARGHRMRSSSPLQSCSESPSRKHPREASENTAEEMKEEHQTSRRRTVLTCQTPEPLATQKGGTLAACFSSTSLMSAPPPHRASGTGRSLPSPPPTDAPRVREATSLGTIEEKKQKEERVAEAILALDNATAQQDKWQGWRDRGAVSGTSHHPFSVMPTAPSTLPSNVAPLTVSLSPETIDEFSESGNEREEVEEEVRATTTTPTTMKGREEGVASCVVTGNISSRGIPMMTRKTTLPAPTSSSQRSSKRPPRQETTFPDLTAAPSASFSMQSLYPTPPSAPLPRPPLRSASHQAPFISGFSLLNASRSGPKRQRFEFTPDEDAAILKGVARYPGCTPTDFQHIFNLFREVWHPVRTASHLYDHWRRALKRRVELQMNL